MLRIDVKVLSTLEMLGIDVKVLSPLPKKEILTVVLKNCEKSAVKHSIEKPILLTLLNLCIMFCSRL